MNRDEEIDAYPMIKLASLYNYCMFASTAPLLPHLI
jgi:hypothetical protein